MLRPFYRVALQPRMPWPVQRTLLHGAARLQSLPRGTEIQQVRLADRPAERVSRGPATGSEAVLYLHGGGFTVGSPATHRVLAAHLAGAARRSVYLLEYRLAPEHPCPAAVNDAVAALEALRHAWKHSSIALAGDSAGGGIALAAAQQLIAYRMTRPSALVLISPWTNPNILAEQRRDLVVSRDWALMCAEAYLGDGDPHDHRYAPGAGPLAGLPTTYLHANTGELLYPQCRRLAISLRDAGVDVKYAESRTLWHAAQAQASLVSEAARSLSDIGGFLIEVWRGDHEFASLSPPHLAAGYAPGGTGASGGADHAGEGTGDFGRAKLVDALKVIQHLLRSGGVQELTTDDRPMVLAGPWSGGSHGRIA
jgi:acetyl esterase/lipase